MRALDTKNGWAVLGAAIYSYGACHWKKKSLELSVSQSSLNGTIFKRGCLPLCEVGWAPSSWEMSRQMAASGAWPPVFSGWCRLCGCPDV